MSYARQSVVGAFLGGFHNLHGLATVATAMRLQNLLL